MKKVLLSCVVAVLFFMQLSGCSSNSTETDVAEELPIEDIKSPQPPDQMVQEEKEVFFDNENTNHPEIIDLVGLDSTSVYGAVYDMVVAPSDHIGQTVRLEGVYYAEYYESTGQYYHYIVVEDDDACCKQGLEFVWAGTHLYPDDYPVNESVIEITGTYGYYEANQIKVYCLLTDTITVK